MFCLVRYEILTLELEWSFHISHQTKLVFCYVLILFLKIEKSNVREERVLVIENIRFLITLLTFWITRKHLINT